MGRRMPIYWLVALAMGALAPAQTPHASAPASAPVAERPADPQRLNELVTLIEGQNSPQARRTGAKELLRQHWPEGNKRLAELLAGSNRPARTAVALALAELPELFEPPYCDPLLAMLADSEPETRAAGVAALSAAMHEDLIPRLRKIMLESESRPARLAAIEILGSMTNRDAAATLMEALEDPTSLICQPALEALGRATANDFQSDPAQASAWWNSVRGMPKERWLQAFGDRLQRQNRTLTQRIRELEGRLSGMLRENVVKAQESERIALLRTYLSDPSSMVRVLALELIQDQSADGRTFPTEIVTRVRELVAASDAGTRSAAIRTLAAVGEPSDAATLIQMLGSETRESVRQSFANALGYLGGTSSVEAVLGLLSDRSSVVAGEAATTLGRFAERDVLDAPARELVSAGLLDRLRSAGRDDAALLERLLTAMGRLEESRFLPVFASMTDATRPAALRLAAVRGLSVLATATNGKSESTQSQPTATARAANPAQIRASLVDALTGPLADADAGVRKAAVDAYSCVAGSNDHLQTLWNRLDSAQESDESIRAAVWKGVLKLLAGRSPRDIESWIARLTDVPPMRQQRTLDLLGVAEKSLLASGAGRAELGLLHLRMADLRVALGRATEAIEAYLAAVDDLAAAQSGDCKRAAAELVKLAVFQETVDPRVAAAISLPAINMTAGAMWEILRPEIEQRLKPESIESALLALKNVLADPLMPLDAETFRRVDGLQQRALELRSEYDADRVRGSLTRLRETPGDEPARAAILQLGERAAPALRAALRAILTAAQAEPKFEKTVYDLLKAIQPDWAGYSEEAGPAEKLKSLERPNA